MVSVLLTVVTRGVPHLAQLSGGIVRRSRSGQLAMGLVLLIPWAVGGLALVMVLGKARDGSSPSAVVCHMGSRAVHARACHGSAAVQGHGALDR